MSAPPRVYAFLLLLSAVATACTTARSPSANVVAVYRGTGDGEGEEQGRALAERVRAALQSDPSLADDNIAVVVEGDEVHLFGRLSAAEKRERAAALAEKVPGVGRVQNHILLPFLAPLDA